MSFLRVVINKLWTHQNFLQAFIAFYSALDETVHEQH